MKIVMINGQNHKGSTYHIGRMLADKLADEKDILEFFLPRDLNHFCVGCYTCISDETKCPFYNEKEIIEEAMNNADTLIFTTPNYCMAPSAPMKAFIDLFFQFWIPHRPRKSMFSKKAVVISTAAGAGMSKAIKPIKRTLAYWGIPNIKSYGIAVQASNWSEVKDRKKDKIEKDINVLARKIEDAKSKNPSLYIRFMFNMIAMNRKRPNDISPETSYWREHGWLDKTRPWKV